MKLTILREELRAALDDVAPAASKENDNAVTLTAKESDVVVSASGHTLHAQADFPADVEEPGIVSVDAKSLREICVRHDSEEMDVSVNRDTMVIKCDGATHKAAVLKAVMSPTATPDAQIVFAPGELTRAIKTVRHAMGVDINRSNVAGLYLDGKALVATDGHRMAVCPVKYSGMSRKGRITIEMVDAILRLDRYGPHSHDLESLAVNLSFANGVSAWSRGRLASSPSYESDFPSWKDVLPDDSGPTVTADASVLESALRRAMIGADSHPGVTLEARGSLAEFKYAPPGGVVDSSVTAEVECVGEIRVGFNGRYLREVLGKASGQVVLRCASPEAPIKITCGDVVNVVMPMRV